MSIKYFDTFAGVGGFSIGIDRAYVATITRSTERRGQKNKTGNKRPRLQSAQGQDPANEARRIGEHNRNIADAGQPTCVGFSEWDKYASQVLKYNYPKVKNHDDITKINWACGDVHAVMEHIIYANQN